MPALARAGSRHRQPFDPITAVLFKIIQAITFLFVLAVMFMNPVSKQGIIDPKDVRSIVLFAHAWWRATKP